MAPRTADTSPFCRICPTLVLGSSSTNRSGPCGSVGDPVSLVYWSAAWSRSAVATGSGSSGCRMPPGNEISPGCRGSSSVRFVNAIHGSVASTRGGVRKTVPGTNSRDRRHGQQPGAVAGPSGPDLRDRDGDDLRPAGVEGLLPDNPAPMHSACENNTVFWSLGVGEQRNRKLA